jgi:hypothetical protein
MLQLLCTVGLFGISPVDSAASDVSQECSSDRVVWVAKALERIQTITPGMTRDALLRVFTTEGGLSFGLQRTFVSRECPYFKVDVTFHREAGKRSESDKDELLAEHGDDVIATISRPYLQFSIMD